MTALQVRDLPPDLYEKLKDVASKEHRSIAQQTIVALKSYFADSEPLVVDEKRTRPSSEGVSMDTESRIARRTKLLAEIEALPKFDVPDGFPSSVDLVRTERDTR